MPSRASWLLCAMLLSVSALPSCGEGECAETESSLGALSAGLEGGATEEAGCVGEAIPTRYRAFAQAFDAERRALGAPGAAVAIIEHGRVTFAHGFGSKGVNSSEPVRASTLFRVGSMTKALTATALLSLVDERQVSLDAKLVEVAPDVAIDGPELAQVTLRQLLSHQTGLADVGAGPVGGPRDDAALSSYLTSDEFRAVEYFMNPPGLFWNYSNLNFSLAGLAVERVGGVLYRQAMDERVFWPLGMRRTYFLGTEVVADGDYTLGKSTLPAGAPCDVDPLSYENSVDRPAGFAYSSALDYARFVRFLYDGSGHALSPRMRREMQRAQLSLGVYGDELGYGLGVAVDSGIPDGASYYPARLVHHGGGIRGFASSFYLLPETGFGIVTLANADFAHFSSSVLLAMRSFGGLPAPTAMPASVAPDPDTFAALAGTYLDPHFLGAVDVSVSGGVVSVDAPALDALGLTYEKVLVPTTKDNFAWVFPGTGPLWVTFLREAGGTYRWLRTPVAVAARVPVEARALTAAPQEAPSVDAKRLVERLRAAIREESVSLSRARLMPRSAEGE